MSIHDAIAMSAFPNGAWLKCANPTCDRGERIDTRTAGAYLAKGWPMHCGLTMMLVDAPQTDA